MQLPTPVSRPGDFPYFSQQVVAYLRSLTPVAGPGVAINRGSSGTTIVGVVQPARPAKATGVVAVAPDWEITAGSTAGSVKVFPSTINQVVPTNWASEITGVGTGTYYVRATATVSGGVVSSVSLSAATSLVGGAAVTAGVPPTSFEFLVGVLVNGVVVWQCARKPVLATATEVYRSPKVSPVAGEFPLDIYYTWVLTQP